jgi:polyhydroxyalkanoate synthesis regulator phasin
MAMANIQDMFKEAWSQALAGVNAAEQEAEKVITRVADAAGFSPDDVRRHAREFGDRLQAQRREVEKAIDEGVRRAASRLRVPTKGDLDAIERRLDAVSAKVDAMAQERGVVESGNKETTI